MTSIFLANPTRNASPVTRRRVKKNGRIFFVIVALVIIGYVMGIMTSLAFSYKSQDEATVCTNETVKRGDTLWTIAERHCDNNTNIQVFIHQIAELNNLDGNYSLTPGQELRIPIGESAKHN
ncbi:MAG: LysM domain-containing protein [Bacillota bacterium]